MSRSLDQLIVDAINAEILPASAAEPRTPSRPWPVVLLSGVGALVASIPLMAVLLFAMGDSLSRGMAPYVTGTVVLAWALIVIRHTEAALFTEQLAAVGLLTGFGGIAFGLYRDCSMSQAAAGIAILALLSACAGRRAWPSALLGGVACIATLDAIARAISTHPPQYWVALLCIGIAWVFFDWLGRHLGRNQQEVQAALIVDQLANGWCAAALFLLATSAGATFLAGASMRFSLWMDFGVPAAWQQPASLMSALLALAAAGLLWHRWRTLRAAWSLPAMMVGLALAYLIPALGSVWFILAVCLHHRKPALAVAAGVAAAWLIGAFYYATAIPLATKGLLLAGLGLALAVNGWLAADHKDRQVDAMASAVPDLRPARLGLALTAGIAIIVANAAIWQKEDLIERGDAVYIRLAPVDPRSLMQGDFMALAFSVPEGSVDGGKGDAYAVASVDPRGIATLKRVHDGSPLGKGERLIRLTMKHRQWTIVTDAWYFKEGEAERWQRAAFGEFRVDKDGKALLVGLRGPDLEAL